MSSAENVVPILMYHEIAGAGNTESRLAVAPADFAAQLDFLHSNGFSTITAAQLAAVHAGDVTSLPPRPVVLTFDDGFADFYEEALPLLRERGFTATVYVTTDWISGAATNRPRPGRMLTWQQIRDSAHNGVEIGAHSCTHPQLDQLADGELALELRASKLTLEDQLGIRVPGLAYPFGYSNSRVRRIARESGYAYACAVGNTQMGAKSDLFALPRLTIRRATTMQTFTSIARGQRLPIIFARDRILTKGWAMVRRVRSSLGASAWS